MGNMFKLIERHLRLTCDSLPPKRRKTVLVAVLMVYILLTAAVLVRSFMSDGRLEEKKMFFNTISHE